jgi:hypothetical protein
MGDDLFLGECLASTLKPASYLFRDPLGQVRHRVEQVSRQGLLGFTKLRSALKLELQWEAVAEGQVFYLRRLPRLWNSIWELKTLDGRVLVALRPRGVLHRQWEVEEDRTGARASARIPNPLILGKQSAEVLAVGKLSAHPALPVRAWGFGGLSLRSAGRAAGGPPQQEVGVDGAILAELYWEEYSWGLGCHRRVRVEVREPSWALAALTLAVARWVMLQQR